MNTCPATTPSNPLRTLIEFYRSLDRECPDVFIMLYWGYRSPWWLQYGDTVFDVGMHMEGASFSMYPALRARDSVTHRLDSGRWMLKDWPALGWDTLGVWLSDWPWNSRVGKEAWQGGVVMDISRGHLLAQLWSDTPYLSPDERRQMADHRAAEGAAGMFSQLAFHPRQPVEGGTVWLLLHRRPSRVPRNQQRRVARQHTDAGTELHVGIAGWEALGSLSSVAESRQARRRARRDGNNRVAAVRHRVARSCADGGTTDIEPQI